MWLGTKQWVRSIHVDCLRDLKRFLRMDEEAKERITHVVLGRWKVVESDLIPLLIQSVEQQEFRMAMSICEILIPLTWPLERDVTFDEQDVFLMYKSAFLVTGVWNAVFSVILSLFSISFE